MLTTIMPKYGKNLMGTTLKMYTYLVNTKKCIDLRHYNHMYCFHSECSTK